MAPALQPLARDAPLAPPLQEMPIFVISLKHSAERFDVLENGLLQHGLTPIRVNAINGKIKASLLKRLCHRNYYCDYLNRPLTPGEIGCFASHLKILRRIVKTNTPRAIILEDDAAFAAEFGMFCKTDLPRLLDVVDIVKLEGMFFAHTSRDGLTIFDGATCRAIIPLKPTLASAGYAVTLRGAKSLLSVMVKASDPFDFILFRYERYWARYCEIRPFLVMQSGVNSVIESDGRSAPNSQPNNVNFIRSKARKAEKFVKRLASAARTWLLTRRALHH
ncbi:MAG: glycosyltransferase family 25 protein [Hyphomicrobium sp.]|nr:glycosyltransferase family 25 protein [Hyphomicrobium sp.]